jgi:hypothetical protein
MELVEKTIGLKVQPSLTDVQGHLEITSHVWTGHPPGKEVRSKMTALSYLGLKANVPPHSLLARIIEGNGYLV